MTRAAPVELSSFSGVVVHGHKRGRVLGFPTANIRVNAGACCPPDGVYSCWIALAGHSQLCGATVSIGYNPTFDDVPDRQVEAYIHDFDADLYGQLVQVQVLCRLRDMLHFATIDELVEQTMRDVDQSRAVQALLQASVGR